MPERPKRSASWCTDPFPCGAKASIFFELGLNLLSQRQESRRSAEEQGPMGAFPKEVTSALAVRADFFHLQTMPAPGPCHVNHLLVDSGFQRLEGHHPDGHRENLCSQR